MTFEFIINILLRFATFITVFLVAVVIILIIPHVTTVLLTKLERTKLDGWSAGVLSLLIVLFCLFLAGQITFVLFGRS